jgi:hypothetical protein
MAHELWSRPQPLLPVLLLGATLFGPAGTAAAVELISVGVNGKTANGISFTSGPPSPDGRFVVFDSLAENLVADDSNERTDVFVRDRRTKSTRRVSLAADGGQGDGYSFAGVIAANGQVVAFQSDATNLVPEGDANGRAYDVFVRDLARGTTERVSVASSGAQGNASSQDPQLSADGRFVVFWSSASDLVPGDTNGAIDLFLRDRATRRTLRVSLGSNFAQATARAWRRRSRPTPASWPSRPAPRTS